MSDDLGKKIQQIAELLGQDNVPDNVKELVAMLASFMASKSGSAEKNTPLADTAEKDVYSDAASLKTGAAAPTSITNAPAAGTATTSAATAAEPVSVNAVENVANTDTAGNNDLMSTARKALSKLDTANDPRINLLQAIKPFMNSRRQKKISNCIQLLQVASLSKLMNERDNTLGK